MPLQAQWQQGMETHTCSTFQLFFTSAVDFPPNSTFCDLVRSKVTTPSQNSITSQSKTQPKAASFFFFFANRAVEWQRWLRQGESTLGSGRALWVTWPGKALCQHGGVIGVSKVKRSRGVSVCVFACVPARRWMNFPTSIKAHLLYSQCFCMQKTSCLYPAFTFVVNGNNMSYPN